MDDSVIMVGNFVDGVVRTASSGEAIDVLNPSTGEKIAQINGSSARDVDDAVQSAARAFPAWSQLTPGKRSQLLHRVTDLFERDLQRFADLEVADAGKPLTAAREVEFPAIADALQFSKKFFMFMVFPRLSAFTQLASPLEGSGRGPFTLRLDVFFVII